MGGWVGPRVVLDAVVKRKIPSPRRKSDPRTPMVRPVAQLYKDGSLFMEIYYIRKFLCKKCAKIKDTLSSVVNCIFYKCFVSLSVYFIVYNA
jgi:hypothetical protein